MTIPLEDIIVFRNEFLLAGGKFGTIVKGGFAPKGECSQRGCEYQVAGTCELGGADAYLPHGDDAVATGVRWCTAYEPKMNALGSELSEQRKRDNLEIAACRLGMLLGETS